MKVLIIEDESFLQGLLGRKFTFEHFESALASNVEEARVVLQAGAIDAILLDLMLPGVDGLSFLKELRADPRWSKTPIIIISNLSQEDEIKRVRDAGASDYIVKAQADPDEVVMKVRKCVEPALL